MALDTTIGGASADSYVSLVEADAYFASRFGSDSWTSLSDADQEKALRQATREVDRSRFIGSKWSSEQALQFPRVDTYSDDETAEIPSLVKQATCEQALWVATHAATGGRSVRQQLQSEGVTSFRVGSASETFSGDRLEALCPEARSLLSQWITRWGRIVVDGREA